MKKSAAMFVLLVLGTISSASVMASVSAELGAGLTLPTGDFGDAAERGWEGHAGLDFPVNSRLSLGVEAAYGRMDGSDALLRSVGGEPGSFDEAKFTLWRAGLQGLLQLSEGTVSPVLGAGVGAYRVTTKITTLFAGEHEDSATDAGVSVRAGMRVRPEFAGAFSLMVGYHTIFSSSTRNFLDLTASWHFGGGE